MKNNTFNLLTPNEHLGVEKIIKSLDINNLVGYSVTGSQLLGTADESSDIDIVLITLNEVKNNLSNAFNIFNTDRLIEILVEDIWDFTTKEQFLGYKSWTCYLIPKRTPIFKSVIFETKYRHYQNLIQKFRPLWINFMLKGYGVELGAIKQKLQTNNLNLNLLPLEKRNLAHICYTYIEDHPTKISKTFITKIKHSKKLNLTTAEKELLLKILAEQERKYSLEESVETVLFNSYIKEKQKIWQ